MYFLNSFIKDFLLVQCVILIVGLSAIANGQSTAFKLECKLDKSCLLNLNQEEFTNIKGENIACIDKACNEIVMLADNNQMYTCEVTNRRAGECKKIFNKNSLLAQAALIELLRLKDARVNSGSSSEDNSQDLDSEFRSSKRALPFETLNYGKRQLPFETLNYGKRDDLPFESILYGKRALPFETLNYGRRKRLTIPDGYIMGK